MTPAIRKALALTALSCVGVAIGCGGSAALDAEEAVRRLEARGIAATENELRRRFVGGDTETVGLLLAAGIDPDVRGPGGSTALMFATEAAAVERLLAAGADPDASDDTGRTALMSAISLGDAEIVDRLLTAGASPDLVDAAGRSSLLLATAMHFEPIVDRLLAAGAAPLPRPRLDRRLLERYVGAYRSGAATIHVALDRGQLLLIEAAGAGLYEAELVPLDENTFYRDLDPAAMPFRFEMNEDGTVGGLRPMAGRSRYLRLADDEVGEGS